MTTFFSSIWWLLVCMGILVTFHEFGHFWVARRCGVKVVRFSVGFGRALWSRVAKDGTEYQIAAVPLGGYVMMLDERETDVAPADLPFAFNRKPIWQRILVVLAGPAANFLLCFALLWLMFVIGRPDLVPMIGQPKGLAQAAGFREGDTLLSIEGRTVPTWTEALTPLALSAIDRHPITITVRSLEGGTLSRRLPLDRLPADFDQEKVLDSLGLVPLVAQDPPLVGKIARHSDAEGHLHVGDRVLAVAGSPVQRFSEIRQVLQKAAREGEPLPIQVQRDGSLLTIEVVPRRTEVDGQSLWLLGIGSYQEQAVLRYSPIEAVGSAWRQTGQMTRDLLGILKRLVTGSASLKNVSGVIGIAQAANSTAGLGLAWFLSFLAAISLSLCIMNLLPIPVLDGGHLLYYLIELVSGRPVSERVLMAGQYTGLALLAGLMMLAFYNDIFRLVS